jgi:hypothetical protein
MIASAWAIGYGLTAMALFGMWGEEEIGLIFILGRAQDFCTRGRI